MLTTIFLYIVGAIAGMITFFLSGISVLVPTQIAAAYTTFFGYVQVWQGIVPIQQTMQGIAFLITLWIALYVVKIIFFGYHILPWLGKDVNLPHHQTSEKGRGGNKRMRS